MTYQVDIRGFKSFPQFKKKFLSFLPEDHQNISMLNACWTWKGAKSKAQYGFVWYGHERYCAHRMSYIIFNGLIPYDQIVRHTCDNSLCVNPKHLILGTYQDNSNDMVRRNRQGSQKLNEEAVKVIKWMLKYKPKYGLSAKLARLHDVGQSTICDIENGKHWSWVKV